MSLKQAEFEYLLALEKEFDDNSIIDLGPTIIKWEREVRSLASKDTFILNFRRGTIELAKYTLNKRYRNSIVLVRYDSRGRHTNPPGTDELSFDGPHVHIYKENYDDRWAFPIETIDVNSGDSLDAVLDKFLSYCNILNCPTMKTSIL